MGYRIGSAFILLGMILLTIFLLSFSIGQEDMALLLAGAWLSLLGLYLRRRNARLAEKGAARFRTLRYLLGRREEEQE
jgi:hypothetical protein